MSWWEFRARVNGVRRAHGLDKQGDLPTSEEFRQIVERYADV